MNHPGGQQATAKDAALENGELRIALAMRGGVSLAVWIGGAVAEVDLMRRAFDEPDPREDGAAEARRQRYRSLLESKGFDAVKVDVLAGASAGGLNAVVYGVAQSAGLANLDWLKDVWTDKGGLWSLMHDSWNLRDTFGVPGVLRGDDVFYTSIRDELRDQIRIGACTDRATDYLTVDLAATLRDGPNLRLPPQFDGPASIPRSPEAAFHFRHTPAPPGRHNDFPATESDEVQLERLAYAARSTSSFPGAFEPARIRSGGGADVRVTGWPGDMSSVFSEAGPTENAEFSVVDGGVFDNIPIARALAAIADSPASTKAKRVLIYLDPSPPDPGSTHVEPERSARTGSDFFSSTVIHALLMKVRTEESSDELSQIREYNSETRVQLRRQERARARLSQLSAAPDDWAQDYRKARADLDGDRRLALAVRPGLGLLRSPVPPLVRGQALTQQHALSYRAILRGDLLRDREHQALAEDARALEWLTTAFIASLRDREKDAQSSELKDLGRLKKQLYLIRAAALFLADLEDRNFVGQLLSGEQTAGLDVASVARGLTESALADSDEQFWSALAVEATADPDCALLWQSLRTSIANDALQTELPDWAQGSPKALQLYGAALVTMVGVPTAGKAINFARITGDEEPAAPPSAVRDKALLDAVRIALTGKRVSEMTVQRVASRPLLRATTKLAGSELANFSGFLSQRWRAHDWEWGRADASSALTRMVSALPDANEAASGLADDPQIGTQAMVDKLEPKERFSDLPADYRYALVAWLVQLLLRAVWPLRAGQTPTARNLVRAFALMAARPVLIFLPLIARPAALGILAATALLSQRFEPGVSVSSSPVALRITLLALLLWTGFLLGRCAGLAQRWALVGDAWPTPDQEQVRLWAEQRRSHVIFMSIVQALIFLLGLWALVCSFMGGRERSWPVLPLELGAMAIVIIAVGEVYLIRLRRAPGAPQGTVDKLWIGVLVPILLLLVDLVDEPLLDRWQISTAVVAFAAAIVASLIHHGWAKDGAVVGAGLFVGAVVFGALVLRHNWDFLANLSPRLAVLVALTCIPLVFLGIVLARRTPGKRWEVALVLSTVFAVAAVLGVLAAWPEQPLPIALLMAGAVSAATTLFVPRATKKFDAV